MVHRLPRKRASPAEERKGRAKKKKTPLDSESFPEF
jgi:hypothetical protein